MKAAGLVTLAVGAGVVALALTLLRPSDDAAPQAAPEAKPALIRLAERKPLEDVAGRTLLPPPPRLSTHALRGEPLFIDVWASWCPSCKEEAPMLARLARDYGDRIRFVGIDTQDTLGEARAFVRRYGVDYPHVFDPQAQIARKLGAFGIPTMFLVDRRGRIAATLVGKQPERKLRAYFRLLLAER